METIYWEDAVFDKQRNKLIIAFKAEATAGQVTVTPSMYWQQSPGDAFQTKKLQVDTTTEVSNSFANGHQTEAKFTFKTNGRGVYTITGELWVNKFQKTNSWHYMGHFATFNGPKENVPVPVPVPDGGKQEQPIIPDQAELPDEKPLSQLDLETGSFSSSRDLFSYLYVKQWPGVACGVLRLSFIPMPKLVKARSGFYTQLLQLKSRDSIDKYTVHFINCTIKDNTQPLCDDTFISDTSQLTSIFSQYQAIGKIFSTAAVVNFTLVEEVVTAQFGSWENFEAATTAPPYLTDEQNIWASILALCTIEGYRVPFLEMLFDLLRVQKVLTKSARLKEQAADEALSQWWTSSVVLPKKLFPIGTRSQPISSPPSTGLAPDAGSSVSLYGIGYLQSVRYQLSRYLLGEIRHIENILQGETREVQQRQLNASEVRKKSRKQQQTGIDQSTQANSRDLVNEVYKTLKNRKVETTIKDYKTNYGMPTAKEAETTGNWWVSEDPAGGSEEEILNFAKEVVDETAKRVTHQITATRVHSEYQETESTYISRFENKNGNSNITGIYQWLNKEYVLSGKPLGKRLVIKLKLDDPAETMTDLLLNFYKIDLKKPASPQEYGLSDYTDIVTATKSSPPGLKPDKYSYLILFQKFKVKDFPEPPGQWISFNLAGKNEQPISTFQQDIPDGYMVRQVNISVIHADENAMIDLMIAGRLIRYQTSTLGGMTVNVNKVLKNLDISVLCKTTASSPPGIPAIPYYAVNIEIRLECQKTHLNSWKLKAYQAIQKAYNKQLEAFYDQVKKQQADILSQNPQMNEELERGQLITQSISELIKKATATRNTAIDSLRYTQYFQRALSWNNMTTQLTFEQNSGQFKENIFFKELASSVYFGDFLRAETATLLIPVQPQYSYSFLYFMSTGNIWQGADSNAPVTYDTIRWVDALKTANDHNQNDQELQWTVVIPSAMYMLSESNNLTNL